MGFPWTGYEVLRLQTPYQTDHRVISRLLHLEHLQRVAEVDAATVLRLELQAVERLDGLADEKRPALRVERAVGAEQDVPGAVEIDAALDRGFRAVDRGVAVEHLEIIQRPLLHALQQPGIVFVRG